TLRDDVQYIFRNEPELLLSQKNKLVIRPADVSIETSRPRLGFLLQKIAHDLFASWVPARLDDLECRPARGSETHLSGDLRGRLFIVASERLILSHHFIGARASGVVLLDSFHRFENEVQIRSSNFSFRCGCQVVW